MKKIGTVFLLVCIGIVGLGLDAKTGHKQFQEIIFMEEGELLRNIAQETLDAGYQKVDKRRFWGWNVHYFYINKEAEFVGEMVFARSNRTSVNMDFEYTLKEVSIKEKSLSVGGNLSIKTKGKVNEFDLGLDAVIKAETQNKETSTQTQDTKWKMTLKPNTKVTLRTVGTAEVSNGASAYYVFGIRFRKGLWEQIEVTTWFYELFEENLT